RYFSAMRALECSTSRMVSPSFSRRVRRLLPAGSILKKDLEQVTQMIPKGRGIVSLFRAKIFAADACYEFRTSEKRRPVGQLHHRRKNFCSKQRHNSPTLWYHLRHLFE